MGYRWLQSAMATATAALLAGVGAAPASGACAPAGGDPGAGACAPSPAPAAIATTGPHTGAANPIDLATGNKHQRELDFGAADQISSVVLVRTYNSRLVARAGAFGAGWMHGYEAALWRRSSDEFQLLQADGRRLRFRRAGHRDQRTFVADDPADGRLERAGAHLLWIWPDGRRLRFAAASGRLLAIESDDGRRVRLRYAPDGRLRAVQAPGGTSLRFAYDRHGRVTRVMLNDRSSGVARRLHYEYDALANLVEVRNDAGQRRRYHYDDTLHPHHLTAVEQQRVPYRAVTVGAWRYDARGRAVGHDDGRGAGLTVSYGPPASSVPGHAGHAAHQSVRVRDNAGRGATYRFARFGDRARLVAARGSGCPVCPAAPARYRYDARGRLVSASVGAARLRIERGPGGSVTAFRIDGTRYAFAADGRLAGWSAAGVGTVRLRRGRRGQVETSVAETGRALRIRRDMHGRVVERRAGAPGHMGVTTRWRYRGRVLAAIEHPHASVSFERDPARRSQALVERRDRLAIRRRFDVDNDGRRHAETLAPGVRLVERRDRDGRIAAIELESQHGRRRLPIVSDLQRERGLPVAMRFGNGVEVEIARDARGRPWRWRHRKTPCAQAIRGRCRDAPLLEHALEFRSDGRIGTVRRMSAASARSLVTRYDYDAAGRLLQATETGAGGRRYRYAYGFGGRRIAAEPAAACDPVHGPAGQRVRCGAYDYGYDAAGRLASVRRSGRLLVAHRYDALGHRVHTKPAAGTERHFLRDGARVVAELDARGRLLRRYVYLGALPVATIDWDPGSGDEAPRLHFLHSDHRGAPVLATDQQARVVWRAGYGPFGIARVEAPGRFRLALRAPGQLADPTTGLIDNVHRWFDPASGSFLTPDPAGLNGGADRHAYAGHDPVNFVDPDGRLLVAFDGTWNFTDPASGLAAPRGDATNVWLLHQLYAQPDHLDSSGQASVNRFYERGIGTDGGLFDRWLGGATGWSGLMKVERQLAGLGQYLRADSTVERTVTLDVIGFSRGAALARDFVNRVLDTQARGGFADTGKCVAIRFLGLFDTVAMFGVAESANFRFDLRVPSAVGWTAHATALNEHHPLLPLESIEGSAARHIEQPLLGGHGDIGGGYIYETRERHPGDLSNVALLWMLHQARGAGVAFSSPPSRYATVARPVVHDERKPLGRLDLADDRSIRFPETDAPAILQRDPRFRDPVYGQNLERLIDAPAQIDGTNFAGTVRMDEYRRWLQQRAGFSLP